MRGDAIESDRRTILATIAILRAARGINPRDADAAIVCLRRCLEPPTRGKTAV
jgi:hypothetical protein